MRDKHSTWMLISGIIGFTFFLLANFARLFAGSSVLAGWMQLCVNAFVFCCWSKAFLARKEFWPKIFAGIGTVFPPIMATITIVRVLIPWLMGA